MASGEIPNGPVGEAVRANVRRIRDARHISLRDLSERLKDYGWPLIASGIGRLEHGDRRIDVDTLVALASVLGVGLEELLAPYGSVGASKPDETGQTSEKPADLSKVVRSLSRVTDSANRALEAAVESERQAKRTAQAWRAAAKSTPAPAPVASAPEMPATPSLGDADRLMATEELADYLGVPVQTLYNWRSKGYGPRGIRIGRGTRYRVREVLRWLGEREQAQDDIDDEGGAEA